MKIRLFKEEIPKHLLKYFKPVDAYPDSGQFILRNRIIWHKINNMPSSVQDRFTNAYEPIFMLVKLLRTNAENPMLVTLSGIITLVKLLCSNALSLMIVTLSGIIMLVRLLL